jgi:hypothetical protein
LVVLACFFGQGDALRNRNSVELSRIVSRSRVTSRAKAMSEVEVPTGSLKALLSYRVWPGQGRWMDASSGQFLRGGAASM